MRDFIENIVNEVGRVLLGKEEKIKLAVACLLSDGHLLIEDLPGMGKTTLAQALSRVLGLHYQRIQFTSDMLPADIIGFSIFDTQKSQFSFHPGPIFTQVLLADEINRTTPKTQSALLEAMEERQVTISRAKISVDFPANFMLLASMNPCPCGYYNHPEKECVCPPGVVQRYLNKVSGPLLDRIDLHVEVTPVSFDEMTSNRKTEGSQEIRERVISARQKQTERFTGNKEVFCNAMMSAQMVKQICEINPAGKALLKTAMEKLGLSARAYDRILKVSRTIADLADSDDIKIEHLAEAIQYRSLDREGWAG